MTRLMFGAGVADWAFATNGEGLAEPLGGVVVKCYPTETSADQCVDLQDLAGNTITQVVTSDGTDGRMIGSIPPFWGPDGVFELWASADSGPRAALLPVNLGSHLGPVRAQLDAHLSSINPNPHLTTLATLEDVDEASIAAAVDGQIPVYQASSGLWVAQTVAGVAGVVMLTTTQTISGAKTFDTGDPNTTRFLVKASEGQIADLAQAWSGADTGQGGAPQRTWYINEKGELRVIAARYNSVAVRIKGQPGQTAHVLEQTDTGNNPVAWWEPNGSWRAPNIGRTLIWAAAGALSAGAGKFSWYNDTGVPLTVRSTRATVGTAPTGASVICDVNVAGVTIYGTQANRPTIAATGLTSGKNVGMTSTSIPDGSRVTVDIDQVGSTTPGEDLVVQVEVW